MSEYNYKVDPNKVSSLLDRTILGLLIAVFVFALVGCAQAPSGRQTGSILGGIAGALICEDIGKGTGNTAAIAICAVAGSMIGGEIGHVMDSYDRKQIGRTLENTPTGHSTAWINPDTKATHTVTPTRTSYVSGHQPCREFHVHNAWIGGKQQQVYGKACRQSDGSWILQQ